MKEGFKTAWSLLWSIPLCVAMLVMMFIMWIGWGTKAVDRFMKVYHDEFLENDGPDGSDAGSNDGSGSPVVGPDPNRTDREQR